MSNIVNRMTIKSLGYTMAELKKITSDPAVPHTRLGKIVGSTTGYQVGQSTHGEYVKLSGEFSAVNLNTGEIYVSKTCLLPNFVSDLIVDALKENPSVEFALEIGVEAHPTAATGYKFTVKTLMETKPAEGMQRLLNLAGVAEDVKAIKAAPAQIVLVDAPAPVETKPVEEAEPAPAAQPQKKRA